MNSIEAEVDGLPAYEKIDVAKVEGEVDALIADCEDDVRTLLRASGETPTFENFAVPLEDIDDRIQQAWAPISHLNAVVNSDQLRAAHDSALQKLTRFSTELKQSQPLFENYRRLQEAAIGEQSDQSARKVVSDAVRDFKLAGVALAEEERDRFKEITERLSVLQSTFANNSLDATDAWSKHVTDERLLEGIPASNLAIAKENAQRDGKDGWLLTLDMPSYSSVQDHASKRELREEMYHAYVTRASEVGPHAGRFDNTAIIEEILKLRHESAAILGFENFAEVSVVPKMAKNALEVRTFLEGLLQRVLPQARRELLEMEAFATERFSVSEIEPWDVRFVTERLREEKFTISDDQLKPYFPLDGVVEGMFKIVEDLYRLKVVATQAPSQWHDDVRFYEIFQDDTKIARFYLDPFARQNKRSGAWMADCRVRRAVGNFLQLPVAYLTCNFTPPVGDTPSLLTHREVVTLFHEFGHGLHHMLTTQKHFSVSGINGVEWDAVELPSQFMENWCWQPNTVRMISSHYQTGESLPTELLDRLIASKNLNSALFMLRQLEFGLFDLAIHTSEKKPDPLEVLNEVRARTGLVPGKTYDRFPWTFGHIFAGGYAAGYYSYLWAEVLSADAFAAFEEEGLFNEHTGQRFKKEILEAGGSQSAERLFTAFRGRTATNDALLRHSGIA